MYRDRNGGGIKLYIGNNIQTRLLEGFTFKNDLFEMFAVAWLLGNHKILMTAIDHPPTPSIALNYAFVEALEHYMRRLTQFSLPMIVAGDLNINLLNPNNFVYVGSLVNSMLELGLTPIITVPTKVNLENPITRFSIIDHIWVSQHIVNQQSFVFPLGITDQFPVGALLRFPFDFICNVQRCRCRPFNARGKITFNLLLPNLDVRTIIGNFNLTFNNFLENVFNCYDVAFPIMLRKIKQLPTAPWITPRLRQ